MNHVHGEHHHHDPMGHSHDVRDVSDSRLLWAIVLNQTLTVAEVIAGILSGSAALLSDAAHNFNDANTLLIAYVARRISRRQPNERFTFGYRRAELIGATINLTLLAVVGVYLVVEGVQRLFSPREIIGWMMAGAAGIALVIDAGTVMLLWTMRGGSLNVRAAFIHNLIDALGSFAVLIGAGAVIWLDWYWVDSLLTLVIASYVLWQVITMLPKATRVLMEAAPMGFDLESMVRQIEAIEGVNELHHVHVWELDEHHRALEAHVVIDRERYADMDDIKYRIKQVLTEDYHIPHSTLEFENSDTQCDHHETTVVANRCT